ncbi:hypothetical protein [Streptomyces virginiae]
MTASETVWVCIGAAAGLLLIATYGWDAWHKGHTDRRFQRTAKRAACEPRTEAEVQRDLDAAKADRRQVQSVLDLTDCIAIWNITPHDIPHQIRRTEEDQ